LILFRTVLGVRGITRFGSKRPMLMVFVSPRQLIQ
jgi:hypothetical protein